VLKRIVALNLKKKEQSSWVSIMSFRDILTSLEAEDKIAKISNTFKSFRKNPIKNWVNILSTLNDVKFEKKVRNESGNLIVMSLSDALQINPNLMSDFGDWCFSILQDLSACSVDSVNTFDLGEEEEPTEHLLITGARTIFTL
jgi:hypothetical protein